MFPLSAEIIHGLSELMNPRRRLLLTLTGADRCDGAGAGTLQLPRHRCGLPPPPPSLRWLEERGRTWLLPKDPLPPNPRLLLSSMRPLSGPKAVLPWQGGSMLHLLLACPRPVFIILINQRGCTCLSLSAGRPRWREEEEVIKAALARRAAGFWVCRRRRCDADKTNRARRFH